MKYLSALLLFSGIVLFSSVALPVVSPILDSWLSPHLLDPSAVSPHPNLYVVNVLGVSTSDYSSPQSWFNLPLPTSDTLPSAATHVQFFSLSLPRLKIDNIPVEINGTDLKKNAIHLTQTALPGAYGNVVVFGHSALPQFYSPQNPLTIFNPLLKAAVGDEILINFDGITYTYIVKDTKEVSPSEISVLTQHYDHHELTLITCTPLGTYWHRFVVRAELEN